MKTIQNLQKAVTLVLILTLLLSVLPEKVQAAQIKTNEIENWPKGPDITAATAILYDVDTQTVLYDKDMDVTRYPASTTKIMTTLLALENLSPDTQITIGDTALTEVYWGSTNINSIGGETFTLDQALHAVMLSSANEISTQIAETVSGSVSAFTDLMNERAREIGCTNTHFNNANGLPDEQHWTTAHDLALILEECIKNERFLQIQKDLQYTIPATNKTSEPRTLVQHHVLMLDYDETWYYDGCFAGKTGFTDEAGQTLVTACKRNGHTLIAVVMGTDNPVQFYDTIKLLDYGYNSFRLGTPNNENQVPLAGIKITVPSTVTIDDLTYTELQSMSGTDNEPVYYREYYLGSVKVGFGSATETELTAKSEAQLREEQKQRTRRIILIILLCILIVIGIIVILIRIKLQNERKRAIQRRKARNKARKS